MSASPVSSAGCYPVEGPSSTSVQYASNIDQSVVQSNDAGMDIDGSDNSDINSSAPDAVVSDGYVKSITSGLSLDRLRDSISKLQEQVSFLSVQVVTLPEGPELDAVRQQYASKNTDLAMLLSTVDNARKVVSKIPVDRDAPIRYSSVVPSTLPIFQWEGNVVERNAPVFVDITACIVKFEDVMFAHRLDFDTNFLRLLPQVLTSAQRRWYDKFLVDFDLQKKPPTWEQFKVAITARFGKTIDEDRAACALALVNIRMNKSESIEAFIDRFNDLRRRAVDQCLPEPVLVDKFLKALPDSFLSKLKIARLSLSKKQKLHIDTLADMTKELFNDLRSDKGSDNDSVSVDNNGLAHSTTNKSKYAHSGLVKPHPNKVIKRSSSPAGKKYCTFHKVRTHDTTDCRAISAATTSLANASVPSSGPVPKRTNGPCRKCGAASWSPQHRCNSAVRIDNGDPKRLNFGAMNISSSTGPSANDAHKVTAPTSVTVQTDMDTSLDDTESNQDISVTIATQAQLCKSNEFSNIPTHKSNSILIPLVVENVKVFGILDTGCTFSIISPRFFKSLGNTVGFTPKDGTVQLGHTESTQPRIGYSILNIYYNKISVKFKFEIFDFFSDNNDTPILLGLDIMSKLNIGITGLVSSWFDYTGPSLPSPIDPEDIQPNNSPYGTDEERQLMHSTLKPLLAANANINLKDTYCNLPGAIVRLETKPGMIAYRKPYPLPIAHKQAVLDQIQIWKDEGVIELAQSHTGFNAPLLCVSKKDDQGVYSYKKPRVVADVRQLNSILLSTDKYQLPLIADIHQRMGTASIISSIDIHSCFTSFLVDPEHRHKLAFTCPFTNIQYIFRKVCFGITFMGNLCQRVLTNLFQDLSYVTVYVDDIQIATPGPLSHHTECVAEVLRRLTQANLQISPEKIVLGQKSIHILGWSLVNGQLIPDPRKISNIHTWPLPTTGKTVSRYLGFFNYFRSSIPMYATLAAKLDSLRNYKSLTNVWTDEHTRAFRNLQTALASALVLSPPDFRYRLHVATDASNSGIGGIIYYIKENKVYYIAMASRKLSTSELNYSTTKRELLAVVYMFTKFYKWLFGITFTLHTDHKSLIFLNHQSTPNMLMLAWYEIIFSHSFDVVHIPGVSNIIPDALSRLFSDDHNLEGDKDICNNKNIFVTTNKNKKKDRTSRKLHGLHNKTNKQAIHRSRKLNHKYRNRKDEDSFSSFPTSSSRPNNDNNYNDISTSSTTITSSKNNTLVNRVLQYADYMTPPEKDRLSIISKAHLLGHFGINAIEKTIHNDYKLHWTNMRQDIQNVVNDCPSCQSHGIYRVGYHPPRSVLPDQVFDHISVDLGDFAITSASGNNFMLVLVDHFTRFTILRALPDKQSYTIAKELLSIFCLFGFPKIITMDNGLEWVNEVVTQLITMSGVDRRLSLPYTPLGNSVCERYVGISKRTIIKTLTANAATADSWDTYLDITQYSMNVQYARLHKSRPFSAMFFRHPNGFEDYTSVKPTLDIEKSDHKVIDEKLNYVKEVVIPALTKRIKETQLFDHERFEKTHKIIRDKYPLNSKVMITNVNRTSKVQPRWIGPLIIKGYTKNGSYILEDLTGSLLSRDVPTQQIRLIQAGNQRSANELKDKHYEVQAIVNHRGSPGNYEYYVHWTGYDDQEKYNTWQTIDTFDSMKPIQDYWHRRQATSSQHNYNIRLPDTINKRKMPARNKHSRTHRPRVTRSQTEHN